MPVTVQLNVHMKSSVSDLDLTIGELARRFGLPTHVLRHWESMGLLAPVRDGGGQRRYSRADLARVAMILMGKEAGLGLRELSVLLSAANPMNHADLLRRHIGVLEHRIAQAQAAKDLIEHALSCPLSFDQCPHAREQILARIPPA
jgi:MerR family transcriptional regulator, copper efflux regulator